MSQWWNALSTVQQILALIAIPSTLILLLQTIMLLFGFGNEDGGDGGGFDDDLEGGGGDDGLVLFSVRGIVAMLCVSGWVGIALLDTTMPPALSLILATLSGAAVLVGMAYLMRAVTRLQSSGNLDYGNAIGKIGQVYIPIPPSGKSSGKITLTIQEKFIEANAITSSEQTLKTGEFVRVVSISEEGMMLVEPIKNKNT